jgi:hypothetical protein
VLHTRKRWVQAESAEENQEVLVRAVLTEMVNHVSIPSRCFPLRTLFMPALWRQQGTALRDQLPFLG